LAAQDKALGEIRAQVVQLSLSAAGTVLRRKVDGADDRRMVEELVSGAGTKGTTR
jgi:F0F1-type ATP synthase membrane subunit b/b'